MFTTIAIAVLITIDAGLSLIITHRWRQALARAVAAEQEIEAWRTLAIESLDIAHRAERLLTVNGYSAKPKAQA